MWGKQLLGELGKVMDQDLSHTGEPRCLGLVQTLKGIMSLGNFFFICMKKILIAVTILATLKYRRGLVNAWCIKLIESALILYHEYIILNNTDFD